MASHLAASTLLAGEHQFPCPRRADQTCQEPGDAVIAAQADLEIAGGKECRFRGDPHVAGHRQREAGADRGAGQGGNGRLAHRDQRAGQETLSLLQVGDPLVMGHCELGLVAISPHALDVTAGAERRARAGQQQHADIAIFAAGLDHVAQGRGKIIRHRVASLGTVQRDDGDAVADHAEQFVGAGVDFGFGGHGSPCCCLCSSLRGAISRRVGKAKRAHHSKPRPAVDGGHVASLLCPPYDTCASYAVSSFLPLPRFSSRSLRCCLISASAVCAAFTRSRAPVRPALCRPAR